MATITTNQTSYSNPKATLSVTATAQRKSNSQITITANWNIYTAGSAQTSGTAYRYLVLCNSGGSALAYASMNRGSWASNTTYTGSCTFTVNASQGTTSMVIGFKVSASNTSISSSGTLIWNGNKSTSTGNPAMQTGSVTFAGSTSAPFVNRIWAGDLNETGSTFAVFAHVQNTKQVQAAVWTNAHGQDDIKWVNMGSGTWNRNGTTYNYATVIPRSDHKNEYGLYYYHCYAGPTSQGIMKGMNIYLTKQYVFNGNGGSDGPAKSVNVRTTLGYLPTTSRTGYTFLGWFTRPEGGSQVTSSTPVTPDLTVSTITLYAHWQANTYTLTYDANGGSVTPSSQTSTYDSSWGTLATPTRTGHTFLGWYTAASGGTEVTSSTICEGDLTVYAQWAINSYTITFYPQGGTLDTGSMTGSYGQIFSTLPEPTRDRYDFVGWFDSPDQTIAQKIPIPYTLTENVDMYAQWTGKLYTVSFVSNMEGVANPSSIQAKYNTAIGTLPSLSKIGYTFMGWYTEQSGGTLITSSYVYDWAGNITLYGRWTESAIEIPNLETFLKIGVDPEYPCNGWYSVTADIEALNIQNNTSIGISDTKPYISNCSNFTGRIDGNHQTFRYSINNTSSNFQNFTGIFNKFSGELNNLNISITIDGNYQKVCGFCDVLSGKITTSIDGTQSNTQNDGITSGICYEMNQGTVSDVSIGLPISSNGPAAGIAYEYISGEVSLVDILPIDGISGKDYVGGLFSIYHMSGSITPLGSDIIVGNITGKDYVGGIIGKLTYQEGNGTVDIIQENVTNILCGDIVGDNYVGIIGYSELQNITPYSAIQGTGTIFSRKSNASLWIGNIEDDNMLKLSSDNIFIKNGDSVSIQASGGNNSIESAYYSIGYSENYGTEITSTGSQGFSNPISVTYDKTTMGEGTKLYVRIGSDKLISTIIFPININGIIGYYGNIPISDIYYGDKKIVKIYKGNRRIF